MCTVTVSYTHLDDAEEDQSGEEFYSLDFGNVRMLMMDSSFLTEERRQSMGKDAWAKEEQRVEAWIRSRTGSCEKPWLAAVIHHPVYLSLIHIWSISDGDTINPGCSCLREERASTCFRNVF